MAAYIHASLGHTPNKTYTYYALNNHKFLTVRLYGVYMYYNTHMHVHIYIYAFMFIYSFSSSKYLHIYIIHTV